jgi:hypothetical protein
MLREEKPVVLLIAALEMPFTWPLCNTPRPPYVCLACLQAAALGRHLARLHPSLHSPVYCSTAVRAEDTARIMLQQAQVTQRNAS